MTRGFPFTPYRSFVLFGFLISSITVGLSGCGPSQFKTTVPIVICTPNSPMVNVYKAAPQPWANTIFEFAFPPFPTPIPPNPPLQFNEQQILNARYAAFQQLINETKRWSDTKTVKLNDSSEAGITLTYLSPEVLQAVFLNQVLKDRPITYGFQEQLQKMLDTIATRDELLFLLTVATTTNNNALPTRHTIKIPIKNMAMYNSENIVVSRSHDDHNLEEIIDTSSDPVFGYLAYPLTQVLAEQCKWILDPKYNTNIVISLPYVEVDNVSNNSPISWTIPYAPLISPLMPATTPKWDMPVGFDQNLMTPLTLPPSGIHQTNNWQDFARFIWNQVTLGNY